MNDCAYGEMALFAYASVFFCSAASVALCAAELTFFTVSIAPNHRLNDDSHINNVRVNGVSCAE